MLSTTDKKLQNRFLREPKLTYISARHMVLVAEAANKDSKQLQDGHDDYDSGLTFPTASSNHKGVTLACVDKQTFKQ